MTVLVNAAPLVRQQFNYNGAPVSNGLLFTYAAGTTIKLVTYTDSSGSTPNTNPIVLDENGQCDVWLDVSRNYKFVLSPAGDADPPTNPYWTRDNIWPVSITPSITGNVDTGVANAYVITVSPPITALTPGMIVSLNNILATNTGASTLNVSGFGALPIWSAGGNALQGGELVAGYDALFMLNHDQTVWQLVQTTGGPMPVAPAAHSNQAVNFGQVSGVVGQSRNLAMSVAAASATGTLTADEIIVESALGGLRYCLGSFNQTINLAVTGAGGMDTGTAPVSGYVALYAIYNPTTGARALLGVNATSNIAPEVYGGANMPTGYTASALVSVWSTNASGEFIIGSQRAREIDIPQETAVSTSTAVTTMTAVNIASIIPKNSIDISGMLSISGTNTVTAATTISNSALGITNQQVAGNSTTAGVSNTSIGIFRKIKISTSQTLFWTSSVGSGTFNNGAVYITGYSF